MVQVRSFVQSDWPTVQSIYQEGIDTRVATFQKKAKEWDDWDATVLKVCRLVAVDHDTVVGWAALSAVSGRYVYRGVAEVSVYVSCHHVRKRIGSVLLSALIEESEKAGFWTLQAGIFPENTISLALHQKCGFRPVGVREKIGEMDGVWRDVMLLERRSKIVGV